MLVCHLLYIPVADMLLPSACNPGQTSSLQYALASCSIETAAAPGSTEKKGYTAQHSTAQHSTAQHSTAQHSTAQHSTAQHSTAQHSTAQHSTAQHSTAQHSTAQHGTAWHGTAQHTHPNTVLPGFRELPLDLKCPTFSFFSAASITTGLKLKSRSPSLRPSKPSAGPKQTASTLCPTV